MPHVQGNLDGLSNPSMRYLIEMCLTCLAGKEMQRNVTAAFFHPLPSSRTQMNCLISSKFDNKVGVSKVITFQGIMAFYLNRQIMFGFYN